MSTFRRWRRARSQQREHSPEHSLDIDNNYDWKINRYQKANWGDVEAKEAHASVVKYLWRKENELNKEIDALKKQIAKQIEKQNDIKSSENYCSVSNSDKNSSRKSQKPEFTERAIETPMTPRIRFRTIEDKTFEKLNLVKCERKLADNLSYIERVRSKANTDTDDDISEYLRRNIRGKSAYQISTAILADAGETVRKCKERELDIALSKKRPRGIYEIMADRNKLDTSHYYRRHQSVDERPLHGDHDPSWTKRNYLNLVNYRMQNDTARGCRLQNHNEIIW